MLRPCWQSSCRSTYYAIKNVIHQAAVVRTSGNKMMHADVAPGNKSRIVSDVNRTETINQSREF